MSYALLMATRSAHEGSNLTTQAYDAMRRDILSGHLEPGSPLRINALAAEREVSLSVIREALVRLSEQGLVTSSPNQGFRVVPLSVEDLDDLTQLRVELEAMALRRSIQHGTLEWEAAIVSTHHVLASTDMFEPGTHVVRDEWVIAHERFHLALLASCRSRRLLGVVEGLNAAANVYRQWAVEPGLEGGRDVAAEHRHLMELVTARRAHEAVAALRRHIELTAAILRSHGQSPSRK